MIKNCPFCKTEHITILQENDPVIFECPICAEKYKLEILTDNYNEENLIDVKKLPGKGLCDSCKEKDLLMNSCALSDILPNHRKFCKLYGTDHYGYEDPSNWEEFGIEEPEYENKNTIIWCPLYSKKKE